MEEQATYNRKIKYDVVIGIDPDVERSGLAILGLYDMKLTVNSHPFPELLEIVRSVAFEGAELGHATWYMSRQVGRTNPTGICHRRTHGRAQPRKASM